MMSTKFKYFGALLVLLTTISFPAVVTAETETPDYESTNDVFERAFSKMTPIFIATSQSGVS